MIGYVLLLFRCLFVVVPSQFSFQAQRLVMKSERFGTSRKLFLLGVASFGQTYDYYRTIFITHDKIYHYATRTVRRYIPRIDMARGEVLFTMSRSAIPVSFIIITWTTRLLLFNYIHIEYVNSVTKMSMARS